MAQDQVTDFGSSQSLQSKSKYPDDSRQSILSAFTIATKTVTTILPMAESMNDTSGMSLSDSFMLSATSYHQDTVAEKSFYEEKNSSKAGPSLEINCKSGDSASDNLQEKAYQQIEPQESQSTPVVNDDQSNVSKTDISKFGKKRNKAAKKSTKLDAKSKLEKSRQSARECRARKKLRYQYLEDLVCNREKAVVKLREELSMVSDLNYIYSI